MLFTYLFFTLGSAMMSYRMCYDQYPRCRLWIKVMIKMPLRMIILKIYGKSLLGDIHAWSLAFD